jgi:GcrA cell cycle regulator
MWTRDSGTLAPDSRRIVAFGPSSTTSRAADSLLERWFCVTAWAASTARRTVGFREKIKARTLQKDFRMSWTDERVELLKKLWSDGLSASQIAAELGGITRNAVIGKVHRLGLSGRAKSASSAAPRPRKARSPMMRIGRASIRGNTALAHAYEMEAEAAPELIDNVIPIGQRRTILELTEQTCRWPVGDPGSTEFFFCGGNTIGGLPYCAYHSRVAYQPASERRRDRRPPR